MSFSPPKWVAESSEYRPDRYYRYDHLTELLHRWVSEGLGLGWRSTWEIAGQLARGELVTVLDDYALPVYDIMAVWPQQRHVPAKVRLFVDHLKRAWSAPDYWTRAS
jgi:DNA-binding transcriptional LysR family regulator